MKGQWKGATTGDQEGTLIINADDRGLSFAGHVFFIPNNVNMPNTSGIFTIKDKLSEFSFTLSLYPVNPDSGLVYDEITYHQKYPGVSHSLYADVVGRVIGNQLHIKATTDIGLTIESVLEKESYSEWSDIESEIKTWDEFKEHVPKLNVHNFLYRGQQQPWNLRTSFHRRGRFDINRFASQDVQKLHQRLSARTKHVFNLDVPQEYGALVNLAQHHGYPTPLLDWSYSPYVATFFGFRGIPKNDLQDKPVRIFIFDYELWKSHYKQSLWLTTAWFHVSVMEFLAIDNERMIPQQSATTVTNIDNIEAYIKKCEITKNCRYLYAIDIPASERNKVMYELAYMGITAGSMFPGFDGVCEELKERMFNE